MRIVSKGKACEEPAWARSPHRLPATASQAEVEELVRELNANPIVSGILVQLPLPKGLNEQAVLDLISLNKDVDGFHPINIGRLAMKRRAPQFVPCTPSGCIELLDRAGVRSTARARWWWAEQHRRHAGWRPCCCERGRYRDRLPLSDAEPGRRGAPTPTSWSPRSAGREYVRGDWIKPGATVIDVGINRIDGQKKSGYRLVGDVDFAEVAEVAGAITPVPGGVGPMTIAMLLTNTVRAFKGQTGITSSCSAVGSIA